ncbi:MAG: hypothetical protein KJ065_14075 [Anaerolineae bacterium]|nr:hypothetical protein [Anaerolineae bacterium]
MKDDKPQPKGGKDKAPPPQQDRTDVSWRGRTPASKSTDEHSDYAFGDINEAHSDKGDEVRDTKAGSKLKGEDREEEAGSRLLGEGQERAKPDDDDEQIRQLS